MHLKFCQSAAVDSSQYSEIMDPHTNTDTFHETFYPDDGEDQKEMDINGAGPPQPPGNTIQDWDPAIIDYFEGHTSINSAEKPPEVAAATLRPQNGSLINKFMIKDCESPLPNIDQTWVSVKSDFKDEVHDSSPEEINLQEIINDTKNINYVVIDSNIFIKNIEVIKEDIIYNQVYYQHGQIYVPRIVHRELDKLKYSSDEDDIVAAARNAKNELEKLSKLRHFKYKGQDFDDINGASSIKLPDPIADDRLLQICLHLIRNKGKSVHLLTLDKGLRTLARDMGIPVSPMGEYLDLKNSK